MSANPADTDIAEMVEIMRLLLALIGEQHTALRTSVQLSMLG